MRYLGCAYRLINSKKIADKIEIKSRKEDKIRLINKIFFNV